jgi:quaternary ammonium compound-resistance protein SugE
MNKYPALSVISVLLRIMGVLVILLGTIASVLVFVSPSWFPDVVLRSYGISYVISLVIFIPALILGLVLYALGDLLRCVMDIEFNTRSHQSIISNVHTNLRPNRSISTNKDDFRRFIKREQEEFQKQIDEEVEKRREDRS